VHQVAFADLVFANHNDVPIDGYVQSSKVPKVLNPNP
jgi:hypothetical protein